MNSTVTQCPECATRFKVSEEQLSASEGIVRCGRCSAVFNATEHFYNDEPSPQLALPIEAESETTAHDDTSPSAVEIAETNAVEHQFNFDENVIVEEVTPTLPPPKRRWPWAVGAALLTLTLIAQTVYFFRVEIAAYLPGAKPVLMSYCRLLKCTVPLPHKADLLSIESSDLEADSTNPNAITLSALLHNRANHVQAFPNLELSLTDMQDKLVARRTFMPVEYLKAGDDAKNGLPANRELTIKLHLDTADLKPTGYKLFLFYP